METIVIIGAGASGLACMNELLKENKYNIKLQYGMFPDRPYDSKAIWGDNSKIEKIMGKK